MNLKKLLNIKRIKEIIVIYSKANTIIANYPNKKAKKKRVNLWELDMIEHYKNDKYGRYNLGDCLARVVVEWMLAKKGLSLETPIKKTRHLNSIGSNLLLSFQNATIWGSGIERGDTSNLLHRRPFRKLDVRAVRGPLTRDYLLELGHPTPPVYGDPAILMPFIYNPETVKNTDYIIIPQYYSEEEFRKDFFDENIVSMMTSDYKEVIRRIKSSKKVISSSLHGIILAEAYGVPAVFFRGLGKAIDFKYKDYYYSTERYDFSIAENVYDALKMPLPPIPDLSKLQKGLIESFPI